MCSSPSSRHLLPNFDQKHPPHEESDGEISPVPLPAGTEKEALRQPVKSYKPLTDVGRKLDIFFENLGSQDTVQSSAQEFATSWKSFHHGIQLQTGRAVAELLRMELNWRMYGIGGLLNGLQKYNPSVHSSF